MTHKLVRFDWAIKKLLRSKANFGILEGFLSELLKRDVKISQLLESEGNQHDGDGKSNRVDMLVELEGKEQVLIEVQVGYEPDYFSRMLYGTSKLIAEYLKIGDRYLNVKKVYSVNILYFGLGQGKDYVYHGTTKFVGIHENDELDLNKKQKELYNKQCVHEIYPEYYILKVNEFNDIAKDTLDEWIYFLKNDAIKNDFQAKGLVEANNKLNEMKLTEKERREYEHYLKDLHLHASLVETNYMVGKIAGKIEGEKIGIEKGEKLGIEKGRAEGEKIGIEKEKIAMAKKMKDFGVSIDIIQQTTGLTAVEIKRL
jgi:predicted transposase/invertase (TIGR01784 family)